MFAESVAWYDAIYAQVKDYGAEAAVVAALVRQLCPGARTVLDVGCGTGEHARRLAREHGFAVAGLDLEPGFLALAAGKLPEGRFHQGDMADFALGARYDAVICLFSAIGYVRTRERLARALACFRAHLNPGGVMLVEPWFEPDQWRPGNVTHVVARQGDAIVCRVSHSAVSGTISTITFHYLAASPEGIRHASEVHELGLFTRAEMLAAFVAAGLEAVWDPEGPTGRGLYTAVAPAGG